MDCVVQLVECGNELRKIWLPPQLAVESRVLGRPRNEEVQPQKPPPKAADFLRSGRHCNNPSALTYDVRRGLCPNPVQSLRITVITNFWVQFSRATYEGCVSTFMQAKWASLRTFLRRVPSTKCNDLVIPQSAADGLQHPFVRLGKALLQPLHSSRHSLEALMHPPQLFRIMCPLPTQRDFSAGVLYPVAVRHCFCRRPRFGEVFKVECDGEIVVLQAFLYVFVGGKPIANNVFLYGGHSVLRARWRDQCGKCDHP